MGHGGPLKLFVKCSADVYLIFPGEKIHYLSLDSKHGTR